MMNKIVVVAVILMMVGTAHADPKPMFDTPPTRESLTVAGWDCRDAPQLAAEDEKDVWKCSNKDRTTVSGGVSADGEYFYNYFTYDNPDDGTRPDYDHSYEPEPPKQ